MRMVGALLAEQDDEWQVSDRRYFSLGSMTKVDALEGGEDPRKLLAQSREGEDGGDESPPLDGTRPIRGTLGGSVAVEGSEPSQYLRESVGPRPPS